MKTLLLIPSYAKSGLDADIAADRHPTMDYDALVKTLRAVPGDEVELLDYAAVDRDSHPAVQVVRKLAGRDVALALMGFLRRGAHDALFTNAENVAMPLALLLKTVARRPRHVTIAHRLTPKKKEVLFRWLKLHHQMDTIFVYAATQREFARSVLGIPAEVVRLIAFHADHRFYRPLAKAQVKENQICAAGLEWRDYPTLVEAVADASDLEVKLAAASPWSKHTSEVKDRVLPAHVDARRYEYGELRDLYAESAFVVVPLYENDFQAGVTTILEAMAMGKAVLVTGTIGQTDVIEDGQNGLYVAPGSVDGWRKAIARLRSDAALRTRLGRAARRWLEENATLERWALELAAAVHGTSVEALAERITPAVAPEAEAPARAPLESGVQVRRPSAASLVAANEELREAIEA